jgi:hypothetical protein
VSELDRDREELSPEDEALVRRIEEAWRAPAMSPSRRVAFRERLDARVAARGGRDRVRRLGVAALATAGAAVLALVMLAGPDQPVVPGAAPAAPAPTARSVSERGEAILSLTVEEALASDEPELPADYAAIASLLGD